jgi:hypothetical protein
VAGTGIVTRSTWGTGFQLVALSVLELGVVVLAEHDPGLSPELQSLGTSVPWRS